MTQALLVMDVQPVVLSRYPDDTYLPRLADAIAAARTAGLPVIYVVVGFRPGYQEVSKTNKMFGALAIAKPPAPPEATAVHPAVAPEKDDIIITKRRVSAFTGSDLDLILRAGAITHLTLTGCATSGVVLSTLREAADRDLTLTVLSDACLDNDPEVHQLLTEKIFPTQATVTTIATWKQSL
ncbi:cysteine hydrolase family protein [Winogradskya humida]|uniref:Isochorismatase n=1 Tax=Winogradskya humida TaxID=113566 RepID=A0ABQ3ZZF3_9ACTN|nr:cysteine hydrolase [Actinoplanes humidus]GIE23967.1 isochorismatase [Actinoplanes humidus]